jgi:hypothetical protein
MRHCGPSRKTVFFLLVLGVSLLVAFQVANVSRCHSFVPPDESTTYLPPVEPSHAEQRFESSSPIRGNQTTISFRQGSTQVVSINNTTTSPYAYAFVIGGCNPEKPSYRGFVYNILVATRSE